MEMKFLAKLTIFIVFGVLTGFLAKRKNRNFYGWGIFGGLAPLIALVVLAFMSYLPKDKESQSDLVKNPRTSR